LAAILGGILGFEREQKGKAAGLRTQMLVALGAALFVRIPQQPGVSDGNLTSALVILYTVPKVARLESRGSQLGHGDIR